MNFYDAHNHLQDERFAGRQQEILQTAKQAGIVRMVVNGSCEEDWPDVIRLAAESPVVFPSLGIHPWYHVQRSENWLATLEELLMKHHAAIGEIGLDRWKEDLPYDQQEEVFLAQWNLARKLNRPASIHCLKAWGRLYDLLRAHPGPECGFVLHSYGGPAEMIESFAKLGAYFSFPGYYAHPKKEKQRAAFLNVPRDRLLIETDAPDQMPPDDLIKFPLQDPSGHPINHPANLAAIYAFAADMYNESIAEFTSRIEQNFKRIFTSSAL